MSIADLIQAVEVGQWEPASARAVFGNLKDPYYIAYRAHNGSLDAAKALHDALLPGWMFRLSHSNAKVFPFNDTADVAGQYGMADNPARAWLLAILRALEAKGRDDGFTIRYHARQHCLEAGKRTSMGDQP